MTTHRAQRRAHPGSHLSGDEVGQDRLVEVGFEVDSAAVAKEGMTAPVFASSATSR